MGTSRHCGCSALKLCYVCVGVLRSLTCFLVIPFLSVVCGCGWEGRPSCWRWCHTTASGRPDLSTLDESGLFPPSDDRWDIQARELLQREKETSTRSWERRLGQGRKCGWVHSVRSWNGLTPAWFWPGALCEMLPCAARWQAEHCKQQIVRVDN